jgi:MOB kinase activator 1
VRSGFEVVSILRGNGRCHFAHVVLVPFRSHSSKRDQGTFRPAKKVGAEHRGYKLQQISQATLGTGDLRSAVKLPAGEALNDWLAVSVVDFFNQLSCLFAPVAECCTTKSCPEMTAGPGFKYYWQDTEKYKKPTMLPANEYITNVMLWTEKFINNEKIFPSDPNVPFPHDFVDIVKKIFQRLFRIYAHIYHHHRDNIRGIGAEAHLNTSFRHFVFFSQEFKLIPEEQLQPLKEIIAQL